MTRKFLIGGLLAAAAVPVLAQTAPVAPAAPVPPARPMMGAMADKVVTRAEVQAMVQAQFARMDANRDGAISDAEMTPRRAPAGAQGGARMAPRDANAAFDRLDANRDGMISRDEFARAREMRMGQRGAPGAPGAHAGHRGKMHRMGGMGGGRMLRGADLNKDGRVTLQEANSAALQHFDKVDANRDGRITPDERRAMHQGLRKAG